MKYIKISQGKRAKVSNEDFEELNKHIWSARKQGYTFYASRHSLTVNGSRKAIQMHRIIMGSPEGLEIDHIDGNGLNNTRENLRIVTRRQNQQNKHTKMTSKYPGVCWHKQAKRWVANITIKNKSKYLGVYKTEEEASEAYKRELISLNEKILN